ncbi:ABC-type transport system ATPase component [Rhodococcus aetherivorans]|uniref:ABC-type transport system ATPase component n=1 Tax=Rhodococcus aetherivorans TaxID=191292 RepID=A0ABQ0YRU6_9NOCA|nr:ABC-type transport system ATPase component [Rhodococcus aetherivorans]
MGGDGDAEAGAGIGEHVLDPVQGVARVDGDERGAGLRDRPHGEDRFERAGQRERDQRAGSGAVRGEQPRQGGGPVVEFAVGELGGAGDDGDRIRVTGGGAGEDVGEGDGPVAGRHERGVDAGGAERGDAAVRGPGERTEQLRAPLEDAARDAVTDRGGAVAHAQLRPGARLDDQAHGVRGGFGAGDAEDPHSGAVGGRGQGVAVERVGLDDGEGVEQFGDAGRPVDLGEPEVLVLEQRRLFGLEAAQQVGAGVGGLQAHPHRHGVDEQAEHGVHAGQLGRAAGDGGAEHHVGAAGELGQGQRPRRLHDGGEGDVVGAGGSVEGGGGFGAQRDGVGGAAGVGGVVVRGDEGGGVDAVQGAGPRGPRGDEVPAGKPGQVVPERRRRSGHRRARRVGGEQFGDEQRGGPAVEDEVVVGQQQPVPVGGGADQVDAQQRRGGQVEPVGAVRVEDARQLAVGVGTAAQIGFPPGHVGRAEHDLERAGGRVAEGGPQAVVPVDHGLRRGAEPGGVHGAGEFEHGLHGVVVGGVGGGVPGVEQQPGLQRGQRPHVGQASAVALPRVDPVLVDGDQREVGGAVTAGGRVADVPGERGERGHPQLRELVDGVLVEQAGRVGEGGGEAVGLDGGVDVEHRGQRHLRFTGGGGAERQPRSLDRGVDAAEEVERDLRGRMRGQGAGDVPEQAVADAVVGNGGEPFLDRPDRRARRGTATEGVVDVDAGEVHVEGVHGGEPSDGAGQVGSGDRRLLAAVALDADERRGGGAAAVAAPPLGRQAERGEQRLGGAAVEALGHGGQHGVGDLGGHVHAQPGGGGDGVARRIERPLPQCRVGRRENPLPQRQFVAAVGLGQAVRPPAQRRADRGEGGRGTAGEVGVGGGQVGQQDAPGHRVHGEVVDDGHEQVVAAVGRGQPLELRDDPGGRIESVRRGLQRGRGGAAWLVDGGAAQHRVGGDRADGEHLERAGSGQPHPQRVVPIEQRLHGPGQVRRVGMLGQPDQHGLPVPVDGPAAGQQFGDDRGGVDRTGAAAGEFGKDCAGSGVRHRDGGQSGDGAALEDVARGEPQSGGAGAGDEGDRDDAVAAEGEETVVGADSFHAEHLGEQGGDHFLAGALGGAAGGGGAEVRGGQRGAVDLPDGGERQFGQHGDRRGHEVGGQGVGEFAAQGVDVDGGAGVPDDVGGEDGRAGGRGGADGDGPGNGVVPEQRGVDLAEFDAEPPDLDLVIGAAGELERGGCAAGVSFGLPWQPKGRTAPAHQVTGAVHAFSGRVRVGHEAGGGQVGAAEIAAGDPGAGQVQLAGDPCGHGLQPAVQDEGAHAADRGADPDPVAAVVRSREGGGDGGLGGAVRVEERPAHRPPIGQVGRAGVATDDDRADLGVVVGVEGGEHGRGRVEVGDSSGAENLGELGAAIGLRRHHHQGGAGGEGHQQLLDRGVEGRRVQVGGARAGGDGQTRAGVVGEVRQAGMGDDDPLGGAGGTGGVDDVGGVLGPQRDSPLRVGDRAGVRRRDRGDGRGVVQGDPVGVVGQSVPVRGDGQADAGAAVAQDVLEPGPGVTGVDGHERGSRLGDGPHGLHRFDGPRQRQRHRGLRAGAAGEQQPGEPVGGGVQVGVGHGARTVDHRDGAGVEGRPGGEQVGQGAGRHRIGAAGRDEGGALVVAEQVQVGETPVGCGGGETVQEREEPPVVRGELVPVVQVGVGLEVEVRAVAARIEVDEQVLDEPGGEHVDPPGERAEPDPVVEQHEVDRGAEPGGVIAGETEVAGDVLLPVPLAAQCPGQLEFRRGDHGGDGGGVGAQPQRHHVGEHAPGAAQRGGGAGRDGQAEHHLVVAGHPGEVGAERGDHQRCEARPAPGRGVAQGLLGVGGQLRADQQRVRVGGGGPAGQRHGIAQPGQVLGPVRTVGLEPRGAAVGLVRGDDVGQRGGARRVHRGSGDGGGVELGGARDEGHRADAVEGDVVDPGVPEPAVLGDAEHGGDGEPVGAHVDRGGVVALHPFAGRGHGIGLAPQIDHRQPLAGVHDRLERVAVLLDDAQEAGAELASDGTGGTFEGVEVEVPGDVDVLGDVDGRGAGQVLCEPDPALGRRERERAGGLRGSEMFLGDRAFVQHGGTPDDRWTVLLPRSSADPGADTDPSGGRGTRRGGRESPSGARTPQPVQPAVGSRRHNRSWMASTASPAEVTASTPAAGSGHPPIEITGTPVRTASAISLSVPQLPPTAMSASQVRTSRALRISPRPVGIDTVRYGLASARSSPGSRPRVVPPASAAPRDAAAITPPSPPVTTTARRAASSPPT